MPFWNFKTLNSGAEPHLHGEDYGPRVWAASKVGLSWFPTSGPRRSECNGGRQPGTHLHLLPEFTVKGGHRRAIASEKVIANIDSTAVTEATGRISGGPPMSRLIPSGPDRSDHSPSP